MVRNMFNVFNYMLEESKPHKQIGKQIMFYVFFFLKAMRRTV